MDKDQWIIDADVGDKIEADLIGGKAANLHILTKLGAAVPAWVVVSTTAFETFIAPLRQQIQTMLGRVDYLRPESVAAVGKEIRSLIIETPFSREFQATLQRSLDNKIFDDVYYAVRSSAVGEDAAGHSFAGQMETYLFVRGPQSILDSIRRCWASAYTDRALVYRHLNKLDGADCPVRMGVIIQEMIFGEVSGVTFTANPLTENLNEIVINATWGLGEGIVSGELNADQFIVAKNSPPIFLWQELVDKEQQIVFDEVKGSGTKTVAVAELDRQRPCLTEGQIVELAKTFAQIEKHYGRPQDIEWTLAKGKLHILQSRPVTTIKQATVIEASSTETIWDNSNITESYSGVTTPLTFSFIRYAYYQVYLQFAQVLKVPRSVVLDFDGTFRNMLGLIRGRVYYNLKNWYRLVSLLPGYNYNKTFMEQMMGVKEPAAFDAAQEQRRAKKIGPLRKYFYELPKLIIVALSLCFNFLFIGRATRRFMKVVAAAFADYRRYDFNAASGHELLAVYQELDRRVLKNWRAPIVNDFMVMIFYGLLKKLIVSWRLDEKGSLQNDLLSGQGDVESTIPLKRLLAMAKQIRQSAPLQEQIKAQSAAALTSHYFGLSEANRWPALKDVEERALQTDLRNYLDEFGYRCMNELKLEETPLKENPEFLFTILKNYLAAPGRAEHASQDTSLRLAAEKQVRELLGFKCMLGLIPKRLVFAFVLRWAKKGVKFREYQRFARTKMFGLVRDIFRAYGRRLQQMQKIDDPRDVFYLTVEEVFSFVEGTAVTTDLRDLVRLRRQEFCQYEREADPPQRLFTRGMVYRQDFTAAEPAAPEVRDDDNLLRGVSCCPGQVQGKVKVILSPSDDMSLNGEILVAGKTDPGWIPLYPSAAGLLIERGSILSHSAIVARELGLPAIVGIPGLLSKIKTGDEVEMDAAAGIVRKI